MKKLPKCKLFLSILLLMPCYTYGALSTGDESKESPSMDIQIKWCKSIQRLAHKPNEDSEAIQILKKHPNIDVNKKIGRPYFPRPKAPLEVAVRGNLPLVEMLIKRGANVTESRTPIIILALGNSSKKKNKAREKSVNFLFFGFLREQRTYLPKELYDLVYKYFNWDDQLKIISFLIVSGANLNVSDYEHKHALEYVLETGSLEIINLFIEKNPTLRNNIGETLLHLLPKVNIDLDLALEVIEKLGGEVNAKSNELKSPLHWAIIENKYEIAQKLLAEGANPNQIDRYGKTPLDYLYMTYDNAERFLDLFAMSGTADAVVKSAKELLKKDQTWWYAVENRNKSTAVRCAIQ